MIIMEKIKIPKDFVLKKVMQATAWHRNRNDMFQSLDRELKDDDVFYKTEVINGKLKQLSLSVGELKEILTSHSRILNKITKGWYEN